MFSPLAKAEAQEAAVYTTTMTYYVQNTGSYSALNTRATIYLFDNISGWGNQEVISESITLDGVSIFPEIIETEDNRWTQIQLGELSPGQIKSINVIQVLKVNAVNLNMDPDNVGASIPQELLSYTQPVEWLFESNDPNIQALAAQFSENTSNLYYKAKQIFDQVLEKPEGESLLTYERQTTEHGALWALQNKRGDCTEFSCLLVAFLRAIGIPAKVISGYAYLPLYHPTGASENATELGHAYVIFYLPNYGWVPADAVWPRYMGSFGKTDYAHIAGASTGGEGVVGLEEIKFPGPGRIITNFQFYSGQPTSITGSFSSGIIEAEILVNVSLQASSQVQDGIMSATMTIKNMGRSTANDLVAELVLDNTYFEVLTTQQEKASLASQEQWVTSFNFRVKDPAYGTTQTLTSNVTFSSSYGGISGTFVSTSQTQISIAAKTIPPAQTYDYTLYIIIGIVVAVIALFALILARR